MTYLQWKGFEEIRGDLINPRLSGKARRVGTVARRVLQARSVGPNTHLPVANPSTSALLRVLYGPRRRTWPVAEWIQGFPRPAVVLKDNPHGAGSLEATLHDWAAKLKFIREGLKAWSGAKVSPAFRAALGEAEGETIGAWLNLASDIRWQGFRGSPRGAIEVWEVDHPIALVWLSALRGLASGWLVVCSSCGKIFSKRSAQDFSYRRCRRCRGQSEKARRSESKKRRPAYGAYRTAYALAYHYTKRRRAKGPLMSDANFQRWNQKALILLPQDPAALERVREYEKQIDPRKYLDLGSPLRKRERGSRHVRRGLEGSKGQRD